MLDVEGNVLSSAVEALGAENNVMIAKITWLSNRGKAKAYESMVIQMQGDSAKVRALRRTTQVVQPELSGAEPWG